MAKASLIAREVKRAQVAARYAEKRKQLKAILGDPNKPDDEKWEAQLKLQRLPRDASPVRRQRRCRITGRRGGCTASLVCPVTSCAKSPCAAMSPGWSKPAGNPAGNTGSTARRAQHNATQPNTAQPNPSNPTNATQRNPTQPNATQRNPTQPNTPQHNPTQPNPNTARYQTTLHRAAQPATRQHRAHHHRHPGTRYEHVRPHCRLSYSHSQRAVGEVADGGVPIFQDQAGPVSGT